MASFKARVSGAFTSLKNFRTNIQTLTVEAVNTWVDCGDPTNLNALHDAFTNKGAGSQFSNWERCVLSSVSVRAGVSKDEKFTYLPAKSFGERDLVKENGKCERVFDSESLNTPWWEHKAQQDKSPITVASFRKYLEGKLKEGANVTDDLAEMVQAIMDEHFPEGE